MKLCGAILVGILALSPITGMAMTPASSPEDRGGFPSPGSVGQFDVTDKMQVPGHLLKAGSYSITVLDRLSDRMVVRVTSSGGKEEATFLAVPGGSKLAKQATPGAIAITSKSSAKTALRGFVFPNGSIAEFVYPKAEAVALAKENNISVTAIDPASEGRKASPSLSHTDMELVTLWMLTPTTVGTERQPGIAAARYQPEVAEATVPPPPPTPPASSSPSSYASPAPSVAPVRTTAVASDVPAPKPRRVAHPIATLPHTASNLPAYELTGLLTLLLAGGLTARRRMEAAGR